jgi:transposase
MNRKIRASQLAPKDVELWKRLYYQHKTERPRQRLRAIKAVWDGQSLTQICQEQHISRTSLSKWLDIYLNGGLKKLTAPEHRQVPQRLSPTRLKILRFVLLYKTPADYEIDSYQWTGKAIREWLEKKWNITLSLGRIYRILDQQGLSHQRVHRDYGPPPPLAKQQAFVSEIQKSLEECPEDGVVIAVDEFALQSSTTTHYAWAEKNSKPKIPSDEKHRKRLNGFVGVELKSGTTLIQFREQSKTLQAIAVYCLMILTFAQKGCHWFKIILDNASIHGKSMREGIKAVLEELATRPGFETLDPVTLSFLSIPPYSPDYNPAEYIIHAVRQQSLYLVPYDVSLEQKAQRIRDNLTRGSPYTAQQLANILRHISRLPGRRSKRKWPLLE